MKKVLEFFELAFLMSLLLGLGFVWGILSAKNTPTTKIEERVDTLIVRDTITLSKPIYVERVKTEKVLVPVTDTIRERDTLFVYLEKESITWRDSLCEVYASGIYPSVDSVRHFVSRVEIVKEIPVKVKPAWSIGISAGYGASKEGLSPYLGVGITYNLFSF